MKGEIIKFKYDACIIGIGRVSLPLVLSLIEEDIKVLGIDSDEELASVINKGRIAYKGPNYVSLIAKNKLKVYCHPVSFISESKNILITVGTHLRNHIETLNWFLNNRKI